MKVSYEYTLIIDGKEFVTTFNSHEEVANFIDELIFFDEDRPLIKGCKTIIICED